MSGHLPPTWSWPLSGKVQASVPNLHEDMRQARICGATNPRTEIIEDARLVLFHLQLQMRGERNRGASVFYVATMFLMTR